MGDIYLRPIMEVLQRNRGRVSIIFGSLPAITLITGQIFFFIRKFSFNIFFPFLGPIATILVNTYGCRKITIAGACLAALGFSASSLYIILLLVLLEVDLLNVQVCFHSLFDMYN